MMYILHQPFNKFHGKILWSKICVNFARGNDLPRKLFCYIFLIEYFQEIFVPSINKDVLKKVLLIKMKKLRQCFLFKEILLRCARLHIYQKFSLLSLFDIMNCYIPLFIFHDNWHIFDENYFSCLCLFHTRPFLICKFLSIYQIFTK